MRLSVALPIWRRAVAPVAEWVARAFWLINDTARADAPIATRLKTPEQVSCEEAKGATVTAIVDQKRRAETIFVAAAGKTIQSGRANCARCSIDDATKNMLDAAKIGRQTANSPEAQLRRARTQRKNALAQHAWKSSDQPAWLTATFYSEKVQPILAAMSASAIARQISVSRWYAGRIRGTGRHWRYWRVFPCKDSAAVYFTGCLFSTVSPTSHRW